MPNNNYCVILNIRQSNVNIAWTLKLIHRLKLIGFEYKPRFHLPQKISQSKLKYLQTSNVLK